jgi:hypothetical protein
LLSNALNPCYHSHRIFRINNLFLWRSSHKVYRVIHFQRQRKRRPCTARLSNKRNWAFTKHTAVFSIFINTSISPRDKRFARQVYEFQQWSCWKNFQYSLSVVTCIIGCFESRSQWPRCLRRELSSLAQTLGKWVRIPLEAWMSVSVYSVFVLSCVYVAALRQADPPSKESYGLCKRSRNWKSGQGPRKGCRVINR